MGSPRRGERGLARASRARGGPRARALTCAGISAETVALAAAAGTQADESNQTFALVREKPQAAGAVVLIYSGRDLRACAWAPASSAQAHRVPPRESEGVRGLGESA